ncbi:hypothetical protein HYY69_08220 [Candidatus Woesearchaeota archaeon]|nr:hypothetical protein [Candidatus Woesearchaeota archaeon]
MILVNCHEPKEMQILLSEQTKIEVKYFTPGDYLIGKIAVERKTYADFLASLASHRLFEQLERLRYCYQVCYLIIETEDISSIRYNQIIYGPIITILSTLSIKVIITFSKKQTVHVLRLLESNSLRYRDIGMIQHKQKKLPLSKIPLQMLLTIPGIGYKRAKLLLSHFGNLQNIFNAEPSTIAQYSGFGRKMGETIKDILSIEHNSRASPNDKN